MNFGNLASGQVSQGQISVSEAIAKVRGAKDNGECPVFRSDHSLEHHADSAPC